MSISNPVSSNTVSLDSPGLRSDNIRQPLRMAELNCGAKLESFEACDQRSRPAIFDVNNETVIANSMEAEPSRELAGGCQDQRPRRRANGNVVDILRYLTLQIRRGLSTTDLNDIAINNRGEHVSLLNPPPIS